MKKKYNHMPAKKGLQTALFGGVSGLVTCEPEELRSSLDLRYHRRKYGYGYYRGWTHVENDSHRYGFPTGIRARRRWLAKDKVQRAFRRAAHDQKLKDEQKVEIELTGISALRGAYKMFLRGQLPDDFSPLFTIAKERGVSVDGLAAMMEDQSKGKRPVKFLVRIKDDEDYRIWLKVAVGGF